MRVRVSTPLGEFLVERVGSLRFEAGDGHRGVLPGHEPACAVLRGGVLELQVHDTDSDDAGTAGDHEAGSGRVTFLAAEDGLLQIGRGETVVLSSWACHEESLDVLLGRLRRRRAERREDEREARHAADRQEVAIRNALSRLRREPGT